MRKPGRAQSDPPPPSHYLAARLGFNALLTGRSSWEEVRVRLAEYPVTQVLEILSRLSALLFNRGEADFALQLDLAKALFGYKADRIVGGITTHLASAAAGGRQPTAVLFDQAQLVIAAKCALLDAKLEAPQPLSSTVRLAEALLMINDLGQFGPVTGLEADLNSTTALEEWTQFLVTNSLFYKRDNRTHELARTWELYLSQPVATRSGKALDVGEMVREATGLAPIEYWSVAFGIFSRLLRLADYAEAALPAWIDRRSFFGTHFRFSDATVEHFFSLFEQSIAELRSELREKYSEFLRLAFHTMPLARWPLARYDDALFCPSLPLLWGRFTSGLHHLLLNAQAGPKEREVYLAVSGDAFEQYVQNALRRAYAPGIAVRHGRLLDGAELQQLKEIAGIEGKFCDAMILYADAAILIEIKAARLRLDRRVGVDREGLLAKLREIFVDAAQQLDQSAAYIEAGRLAPVIDPRRIKRYYPLIVHLEDIVIRAPIYRLLDRYIAERGSLSGKKFVPWQAFAIGDIEWTEGGIAQGHTLRAFLDRKLANHDYRMESATNYYHASKDPFFGNRSPYLEKVFEDLADRARAFFADHAISNEASLSDGH